MRGRAVDIQSTVQLHTGRAMPILGLGTWQLTKDTAGTIERALELGYRLIDTSGDYGTQSGVGEGVRKSGLDRDDISLVTKVEEEDDAYDATVANLSELGLESADTMLIHRPADGGAGKQLWEGLLRARKDGLTKEIGVSNYSIEQIDDLVTATDEVPVVNQIEWSPFGWSRAMLDHCRDAGIVIQAYSPLTRAERLDHSTVTGIAKECGKTPGQILIRWALQLGVVPLPKANRAAHLEENADVFDFELNDAQMERLNDLNEQWSSLG